MTEITVANRDWGIIAALKSALAGATIAGSRVFAAVSVTTSPRQADQCQFKASPIAVLRYLTTAEQESPDEHYACAVHLELTVAAKVNAPGTDESSRLQEILRLLGAARNAINASKPAESCAWGDADFYVRRVEFDKAQVDAAESLPWAVARLPLTVGYTIDNDTSH